MHIATTYNLLVVSIILTVHSFKAADWDKIIPSGKVRTSRSNSSVPSTILSLFSGIVKFALELPAKNMTSYGPGS